MTDTPEPIEFTVYVAIDECGAVAACTEDGDINDAFDHLAAGYRVIRLHITATPPVDTELELEVPGAAPGEAKAMVAS